MQYYYVSTYIGLLIVEGEIISRILRVSVNLLNFISLKFLLSSQNIAYSLNCVVVRFVDMVK